MPVSAGAAAAATGLQQHQSRIEGNINNVLARAQAMCAARPMAAASRHHALAPPPAANPAPVATVCAPGLGKAKVTLGLPAFTLPYTIPQLPISNQYQTIPRSFPQDDQTKLKFAPYIVEAQEVTINTDLYDSEVRAPESSVWLRWLRRL